jgi:Mrp family chromosome partitioning ATPase/capsular polysaccharide biosynthesis protein
MITFAAPPEPDAPLPVDLRTILVGLRPRYRWFLFVAAAALAVGLIGGLTVGERQYGADTVLLYRPIRGGGEDAGTADSLPLLTQANLVKIRSNLEETRKRLEVSATLERLGAAISVNVQKNTSLMTISSQWDNPETATGIANTVRDVFLANQIRLQYRDDLAVAEYVLKETTLRKQMLDAQVTSLDAVIANLQARVAKERNNRPEIESLSDLNIRIGKLREAIYDDRQIRSNAAELAQRELELERARKGLADGVMSQAEFEDVKAAYEKQRIATEDTDQIKTWKQDLNRLNGAVLPSDSKAAPSSLALQEVMVKAALLEFDRVGMSEKLVQITRARDEAAARLGAFEAAAASADGSISIDPRKSDFRIISEARIPTDPLKSNRRLLFMGLSALVLLGGLSAIVAWVVFHPAARSAPELAARHRLASVTGLPEATPGADNLVPFDTPEALERIRLVVQRMRAAAGGRATRILVLSAESGEGRTSVAAQIAACLGRQQEQVLLIDGSVRGGAHPDRVSVGALARYPGSAACLGRWLDGSVPRMDELIADSRMPNVATVAGPTDARAPEMLASTRMEDLLKAASNRYGTVIIDGPAVLPFADAAVLLPQADAVVFVVGAGQKTSAVRRALAQVQSTGTPVIATVLNRVQPAFLPLG